MIHAFVLEGEEQLHDQVYDAIRAEIEQKRQRAVIGPWRFPLMNKLAQIGLGAAAVVGVLFLGYRLLGPPSDPGGDPSLAPSPSVVPSASASPSPSPAASVPPALTETFTSERYGFSMSYPTGWVARPATEPWTTGIVDFASATGDVIYDPVRAEGQLWIAIASQPLGNADPQAWLTGTLAFDDGCPTSEPITIDAVTSAIGTDGCTRAALATSGRGYFFWLYTGNDDPSLADVYDRAWFEGVLATVQLQPENAVDAAAASP
jgi:hypothetical protein